MNHMNHMNHTRSVLHMTDTIPPGQTVAMIALLRTAFRPERLVISPASFQLPWVRRAWTRPLVATGGALSRVHRGIARILRVDLHAARERQEFVSMEYARAHPEEVVSWGDEDDDDSSDGDGRPSIHVPIPLSRRERLLAPLGRASAWLPQVRRRWQEAQLSTLRVCSITIAGQPQLVSGAELSASLFSAAMIGDSPVRLGPSCAAGHEIRIEVRNDNRRACQLMVALIGTARTDAQPQGGQWET